MLLYSFMLIYIIVTVTTDEKEKLIVCDIKHN